MDTPYSITDPARFFREPAQPRQRQYEALRAYFVDAAPSAEAARRFGYTPGSFRVLCHKFRQGALGAFFQDLPRGPQVQTKKEPARPHIIALRKQNLSIYDIQDALGQQGHALSLTAIHEVLRAEASRGSPGAGTPSARRDPGPSGRPWPTSGRSPGYPAASPRPSAGCSSSCLGWCAWTWPGWWPRPTSPAPG